jgi:uncharacterized Zn-binding protein involved in type VI secretion
MGQPAAKLGDAVVATDIHLVVVPVPFEPPVPLPLPHPFAGRIDAGLSSNVRVMGLPAAIVGSTARNTVPHVPTPPGISFVLPPTNLGVVAFGSLTVRINGKPVARLGDRCLTCNDPVDLPVGTIIAAGTVLVG